MQKDNEKWIILGQFHWTEVGILFKNSCNHTSWMAVRHLGHLLNSVMTYKEVTQYELEEGVERREACAHYYWVACVESEKESTLKLLNET